jgi:hypothetical protein
MQVVIPVSGRIFSEWVVVPSIGSKRIVGEVEKIAQTHLGEASV